MNQAPSPTYRLSAYEGPLDLLYRLIQANKIDIFDIPIAELTNQYIEFLEKAEDRDMDSMSEFLLLAATLIEIKSRMLLPKSVDGDEEDPRAQLVDSLLEYRKAKLAAQLFSTLEIENDGVFYKAPEHDLIDALKPKVTIDDTLEGVTPFILFKIFKEVMGRKELKIDRIRSSFKAVEKDLFTVKEKAAYILSVFEIRKNLSFKSLMSRCVSKMEKIVTFLAMLELVKEKEINARQKGLFEDIELRKCVK